MKIAIFTDNYYPELSGITDSVTLLAKALGEHGHSVLIVAPRYSAKDYRKAGLDPEKAAEADLGSNVSVARMPSLYYHHSPTGQARIAVPLGPCGSVFKKIRAFKPDVIHTQSPFGAGIDALIAAKILKIPLIGTNHTPISEFMAYSPFHPKWFVNMSVRYFSWYYNRCSFVSAPCNALLEDMANYGFKKSPHDATGNCRAISNPVNLAHFSPPASETAKKELKKRFSFSPHTVLYTGRLAKEKHVDDIIRAIAIVRKEIPDAMLAATGHGNDADKLKKLTHDLGLDDAVKFLGYLDMKEFSLVYQASDIFAVMSTAETQCLSLMQAFATGLPGIGVRAWGLPEYIDEKSGYILEPADVNGLARILINLFKSPSLARELGQNGVQAVARYAPPAIAAIWETEYVKYSRRSNYAKEKGPALPKSGS